MKKVLVVDDNYDILNVINLILEMEGYQVKLCDNGADTVSDALQFSPDLILLDIMLGDHDGREICKYLKELHSTAHIPIVMISASHSIYNLSEKDCNADGFLSKPFEVTDLLDKIKQYIN